MNRNMKIGIVAILLLLTIGLVAAAITNGQKNKTPTHIEKPVKDIIPENIQPASVEQSTYTDIWTNTNSNLITLTGYTNTVIFSQSIYLKFPSTITVQFSSETQNNEICNPDCYTPTTTISATIDGNYMPPGGGAFFNQMNAWQTNSFTFAQSYVSAGSHTINIVGNGENGNLWYKSLVITANGYGH